MHNTWHMAPASIHRHKAHPEQSAHNSGQRDNQKRMKPLNRFSFKKTWAHTFLQSCYPTYYIVFACNLHPPPVPLLVSQHCADSVSLWRAEWCMVWSGTHWRPNTPQQIIPAVQHMRVTTQTNTPPRAHSQMMLNADSNNSPCSR